MLRWVSQLLFIGILQGIAAGIGTSNFPRAALFLRPFGSMKNIPLSGIIQLWFLDSPFLLFFLFGCIDVLSRAACHVSSLEHTVSCTRCADATTRELKTDT